MNPIVRTFQKMRTNHAYKVIERNKQIFQDASGKNNAGAAGRELALGIIQRAGFKSSTTDDFEDPDYSLKNIQIAYDTDSYVRQGTDKYVDQIFKEGFTISGPDSSVVDYLKMRLSYMAEATDTPFEQFLIDIADDVVKFANCMIIKVRSNDPNAFPQGVTVQGLNGKDAVAGYFVADATTMTCKRDANGTILKWQQESANGQKQEYDPEDIVHIYYKRAKGNAYGTSFLVPVIEDVKSLRQEEENVLKMMYRNIYPFYHVKVGTEESPGTATEINEMTEKINDMDIEGGIVTSERVTIEAIATDKVVDASPYLAYMENRVFSGLGIPAIMFGRGNTANRSTGDNMTSEMSDRIRAYHKVIAVFVNAFIFKELLLEGGYDPVLEPNHKVELEFNDNDVDVKIKKQVHAIYKYEHNAITEDEMRAELGKDPVEDSDREHMFVELITRPNMYLEYGDKMAESKMTTEQNGNNPSNPKKKTSSGDGSKKDTGTKETNNKEKNSGGAPPKNKNALYRPETIGVVTDVIDSMTNKIQGYITDQYASNSQILMTQMQEYIISCSRQMLATIDSENPTSKEISSYIINCSVKLSNSIRSMMIGTNTNQTPEESLKNVIDVVLDVYRKSITTCMIHGLDKS